MRMENLPSKWKTTFSSMQNKLSHCTAPVRDCGLLMYNPRGIRTEQSTLFLYVPCKTIKLNRVEFIDHSEATSFCTFLTKIHIVRYALTENIYKPNLTLWTILSVLQFQNSHTHTYLLWIPLPRLRKVFFFASNYRCV